MLKRNSKKINSLQTTPLSLLLIAIVGFLCYSNTFNSAFLYDDRSITENNLIEDISDLEAITNLPVQRFVTFFSFAVNYHFGKLNVFGYHLANLIIHVLTSMLVFWFVGLIIALPEKKPNELTQNHLIEQSPFIDYHLVPLFAALLFIAHPLQTEAVTYISQRAASLATFFYLLSMILYLKGATTGHEVYQLKISYFSLSLISAVLAMHTKEIAFTLPLAIILIEVYFLNFSWGKIKSRRYFLFFLITIFIIPITIIITRNYRVVETESISRIDYLLTQFNVIRTYLRLLFLPINQNLEYDFPIFHNFFGLSTILSFLLVICLFFLAIRLFKSNRLLSFGIMFFFSGLSIESSIIPISNVIFEHRLYLPMIGFVIAASTGLFSFLRYLLCWFIPASEDYSVRKKYFNFIYPVLILLLVTTAGSLTFIRNFVWKDNLSLWSDIARKSPGIARAHYNLGIALEQQKRIREAVVHYNSALQINPKDVNTHNNLGNILSKQGKVEEALTHYFDALNIKPNDANAHNNIGGILYAQGKLDDAIEHYSAALQNQPNHGGAHFNIGVALSEQGKLKEAATHFSQALKIKPDLLAIQNKLGIARLRQGRLKEAMLHFSQVLRVKPGFSEAHNNMGIVLARSGKTKEAMEHFSEALRINPDFLEAKKNLRNASNK